MSHIRYAQGVFTILAFTGALSVGRLSLAQDEKIAAEAIFNEARTLMDQGRFAEACPKLAESQRLDPAVGTLLYLGECYEKEGKVASAWAAFKSAASAARNAGQTAREQTAKQHASDFEPRLPKLTLVVPPGSDVSGLVVQRDDIDIGSVAFGTALPVDPGKHHILAQAPGKKPWSKDVDIGTQASVTTVTVPRLDEDPSKIAPPSPTAPGATPAPPVGGYVTICRRLGPSRGKFAARKQSGCGRRPAARQRHGNRYAHCRYFPGNIGVSGVSSRDRLRTQDAVEIAGCEERLRQLSD